MAWEDAAAAKKPRRGTKPAAAKEAKAAGAPGALADSSNRSAAGGQAAGDRKGGAAAGGAQENAQPPPHIPSQFADNPLAAFKKPQAMEAAEQRRAAVPPSARMALSRIQLPADAGKKRRLSGGAHSLSRPIQQVIPPHLLLGSFQAPKIRKN